MKAYVLHGIDDIRFEEVPKPVEKEGWARIKVMAAGICGSDIPRIYRTGAHMHPIIPGHEFSGIVESVGKTNSELTTGEAGSGMIGKRVGIFPLIPCGKCPQCKKKHYETCCDYDYLGSRRDGGFSEYVNVPLWNLIELPNEVSFETAAMLEPFSVAVHAVRQAVDDNTDRDAKVLVWGLGTIGIVVCMILNAEGFKNVYCVGNKEIQAEMVEKCAGISKSNVFCFGDLKTVDKNAAALEGGFDFCFECVGKTDTYEEVIRMAAPMATVVLVGNPYSDMTLSKDTYWRILRNQLVVKGTWNSSFCGEVKDDWHYALSFLQSRQENASLLITHRYALKDLQNGFEMMRDKSDYYIKCMTRFGC